MKTQLYTLILAGLVLISCGGGGGGESPSPTPTPDPVASPKPTTLVFPDNNADCFEGVVENANTTKVNFQWNAAEDTDSYSVTVRNLDADTEQSYDNSSTSKEISLLRGTAYSWKVVSKANGTTETATSATWKFYNAGPAIENHAPQPAALLSPTMGTAVASGVVTLKWQGSDVDTDIASYNVYIDTTTPPATLLGNVVTGSIDFTATANTVYYWRVETIDSYNNTSFSEVFEFRAN